MNQLMKGFLFIRHFSAERQAAMPVKRQPAQENKDPFRLRPARLAETGPVRAVARETWEATYAEILRPSVRATFITNSYSNEALRQSFSREGQANLFWVAEETGPNPRIIGFAEVYLRPSLAPDAELTRIYVLPAWQKKGVGKALLEALIQELRALRPGLRPPRLWLSVAAENHQAIAFYEQRGFQFNSDFEANLPGQTLAMQEYVLEI
jgi:ribosomal protein S18 acetylase RimI-like enzyme